MGECIKRIRRGLQGIKAFFTSVFLCCICKEKSTVDEDVLEKYKSEEVRSKVEDHHKVATRQVKAKSAPLPRQAKYLLISPQLPSNPGCLCVNNCHTREKREPLKINGKRFYRPKTFPATNFSSHVFKRYNLHMIDHCGIFSLEAKDYSKFRHIHSVTYIPRQCTVCIRSSISSIKKQFSFKRVWSWTAARCLCHVHMKSRSWKSVSGIFYDFIEHFRSAPSTRASSASPAIPSRSSPLRFAVPSSQTRQSSLKRIRARASEPEQHPSFIQEVYTTSVDSFKIPASIVISPEKFVYNTTMAGKYTLIGTGSNGEVFTGAYAQEDGIWKAACIKHQKQRKDNLLVHEYNCMKLLKGSSFIPEVHGIFYRWGPGLICSPGLVMEYIAGDSLYDTLKNGIVLHISIWYKIAIQLAEAVDYVHSRNVLLNDLKFDNVLLKMTPDVQVVLIDFGNSSLARGISIKAKTAEDEVNYPHVPPEVLKGEMTSVMSDIFGYGYITLFICTYAKTSGSFHYNFDALIRCSLCCSSLDVTLRPRLKEVSGYLRAIVQGELTPSPVSDEVMQAFRDRFSYFDRSQRGYGETNCCS